MCHSATHFKISEGNCEKVLPYASRCVRHCEISEGNCERVIPCVFACVLNLLQATAKELVSNFDLPRIRSLVKSYCKTTHIEAAIKSHPSSERGIACRLHALAVSRRTTCPPTDGRL